MGQVTGMRLIGRGIKPKVSLVVGMEGPHAT